MIERNSVLLGDCLELMKDIPDKSIDILITDVPYGINENNKKNLSRSKLANCTDFGEYLWDKTKIDRIYFNEMNRVSKNQIIFGGNYYGSILGDTSCYIVWYKDNFENDFADCELAWTSFKTATRFYKFRWAGMLQENMKNKEIRLHPTQKPVQLFKWILKKYTKESDLILDPFAGSGTTAIACMELKRDYILMEKEPKYYDIIQKRISEQHIKQRQLELI